MRLPVPEQSPAYVVILFVSCICLLLQLSPTKCTTLSDDSLIAHISDYAGVFIRTRVNNGALDANGAGNNYTVVVMMLGTMAYSYMKKFDSTWKWVTVNNLTPPFQWLKWRFDSTLLKTGPPPNLETGATGQVCLECNGSSVNCNITVAACHGDRNQHWRTGVLSRHTEMTFNDTHNRRYFSIFSELHPERCITLAGTLTTTFSYLEVDPARTYHKVQKFQTVSGLGYNLDMCTGSDEQTFYIEEVNF